MLVDWSQPIAVQANAHSASPSILRNHDGYMIEVGQSTGLLHGKLAKKRPEDLPGSPTGHAGAIKRAPSGFQSSPETPSCPRWNPSRFCRSPGFWSPWSRRALIFSCAAGRLTEAMQASQPALISTSGGRLASLTRRLVLAIAHVSNEAIRVASDVDELVELGVRERSVHVAEQLGVGASDVVRAQEHLEGASASHDPRQSRHGPSTGDEAHAHFPLRKERVLSAREAHIAGERELAAVPGRPAPDQRDRNERGARQAHQDVGPCLEARRALRDARQLLEVREEVRMIQKEPVDGTFEDHHLHSVVILERRDDLSDLPIRIPDP